MNERYRLPDISLLKKRYHTDETISMEYVNLMKEHIAQVLLTIGKNVELSLCRIAQLASTVGIHAIIATQRPTKNIISGTIKANFPTRLSFRMACLMDSRLVIVFSS